MRVLMLSRDGAGLHSASETAKRWKLLRDQGVELDVVVVQRAGGHWEEDKLRVFGKGGGYLSRFFKGYAQAAALVERADVISAQDPFELGCIAFMLAKKFHKKFEIQDHGGFYDGEPNDEPLWFVRGRLARFLAKRANIVRTVSPKSFLKLNEAGNVRVYHLPIAVNDRFFRANYHPEPGNIVTVSRLIPVKCVESLLRVFAEAHNMRTTLTLTIVGDGPDKDDLVKLADALHISDAVDFVGQRDPLPYLEKAVLFIMVSKHEGWGVAAVEAAAVGVPVLMSDTGCAQWLVEKGAAELFTDGAGRARQMISVLDAVRKETIDASEISSDNSVKRQVSEWLTA